MKYDENRNGYVLSTGTRFYANNGIIGISEFDPEEGLGVSEGYDGGVMEKELTPAEWVEVADFMIEQWTKFRQCALEKGDD